VLHSVGRGTVEFLVAPTTMLVDQSGVRLLRDGALLCPPPGRAVEQRRAPVWVVEPDGIGRLMDIQRVLGAVAAEYVHFARDPEEGSVGVTAATVGPRSASAVASFFAAGGRAADSV
ncbi:hypothetical protein ACFVXQ_27710, partial [Kitasatospora sp. NPDC058263]